MKKLVFLFLLFISYGVLADDARSILEQYLNDTTTFEARFEQSLISESNTLQEVSSGKFYLSRPGRFRWEYTKPYEQSIIADEKNIWVYDKDLDQVTVRKMSDILADSPALLLSNKVAINKEFIVTREQIKQGGNILEWFRLRPKDQDKQYSEIKLAFEAKNLKVMELKDNFGQLTRIVFFDQKKNRKLDPGLFQFEPPPGVDVLHAES